MPLNIGDYMKDTGHLSTVEHGAYMLLIMHYWCHDGLPPENGKLAKIAKLSREQWDEVRDTLADLFLDDWRHKRVEEELAKAKALIAKKKAAGKAGASARYGRGIADAEQTHAHAGICEGTDLDTSPAEEEEASPREGTTSAPMARLEFASTFWPEYPHKVGRSTAAEAFVKARRKATLPEIMDGLARYKSDKPPDRQWLNPATFLNQQRWTDEPAPSNSKPVANGASSGGTTADRNLASLARIRGQMGQASGEHEPGAVRSAGGVELLPPSRGEPRQFVGGR